MNEWQPSALFETPGMMALFIAFILAQVLSLGFLWFTSYEFRHMLQRHTHFFQAIHVDSHFEGKSERVSRMIFLTYVLSTIAVAVITTILFIFQPHLL